MRKNLAAALLALLVVGTQAAHAASECAPDVKKAIENNRKTYVDGMSGVASTNYSMRPGTFGDMACLDRFMKGDMDIFFRPTDLNSLLEQVKSFACEKLQDALGDLTGGGGGGLDAVSLFSDVSKGGNFGFGSSGGSSVSAPSLKELFAR